MPSVNQGRYGVFGVNPYGEDVFTKTLAKMEGLGKLQNTGLANDALRLKNEAEGISNEFLPKELQSKLGLTDAQIRELNARAGLAGAQASHFTALAGKENPLYEYQVLLDALKKARPDSPEALYIAQLLDRISGGSGGLSTLGAGTKGTTTVGSTGGGLGSAGSEGIQVNPLGGSNRSSFHQGVIENPDGTFTTIESPTTASASQGQQRMAAEAEVNYLAPLVNKGLNNYSGPTGSIRLTKDLATYQLFPNTKEGIAAKQKILEYDLASRLKPNLASMIAKLETGQQPGIELLREFSQSNFSKTPTGKLSSFIPQDVQSQVSGLYTDAQKAAAKLGVEQERTGFPLGSQTKPTWEQNQIPRFRFTGNPQRDEEEARRIVEMLNNPNANRTPAPQPQNNVDLEALAEAAIAKGADPQAVKARLQQLRGNR